MNIAMLLPSLARTGPGIVVQDLCTEYVKFGHKCKVLYFDNIVELEMPCETQRIKFRQSFDFDNWDIIHSHMFRPDLYLFFHRRKINRAKTISTLHNPISVSELHKTYSLGQSLCGGLLWPLSLCSINHIVTLNPITHDELCPNLKKKSSVIFNGRDITVNKDPLSLLNSDSKLKYLNEKYCIIGSICSLTKRKGLDQIIKALKFIPDFAFVSLGTGPEIENLINLSKECGVDDRCHFIGFKENATDYASIFDVFVMTSKSEGFPLALIEAAAYGIPTVLSDIPILKSIISKKEVCFYRLDNIRNLADSIMKATKKSKILSTNIQNYYFDNLTAEKMASKYILLYNQLVKKIYMKMNNNKIQ